MTPFVQQALAAIRALEAEHEAEMADDAFRLDMIEGETQSLEALDWLIRKAREADNDCGSCGLLAKQYTERAKRHDARGDAYRDMMRALLEAIGAKSIKRPAGTVSVQQGRISTAVNADELPQGFFTERTVREKNSEAITAALAAGEQIPGVTQSRGNPFVTVK